MRQIILKDSRPFVLTPNVRTNSTARVRRQEVHSFERQTMRHYYRGVSGGARGGGQLAAELWGMSWRSSEMALNDYSW